MHAIIEIKNNEKSLIATSIPNNNFLDYIKKRLGVDNYSLLENISPEELRDNEVFKAGKYLIMKDNYIIYIEKIIVADWGLFYSKNIPKINILCEWERINNAIEIEPNGDNLYYDNISYKDSLSSPKSIRRQDSCMNSYFSDNTWESSCITEDILEEMSEVCSNDDITITKFNLNSLPKNFKICMIGTTDPAQFVQDILDCEDESFIENSLAICDDLNKYLDMGIKTVVRYNQQTVTKYLKDDKEGCLILDNCLNSECDWIYNLTMADIFKHQTKKSIILITHKPIPFTKEIVKQFDFLYLFKYLSCDNIQKIYEHVGGIFPNYTMFKNNYFSLTTDSLAMVLDNKTLSTFILDRVFIYQDQIDSLDTQTFEIPSYKKIQTIDFEKMKQYGSIHIIGKRQTGKSSIISQILEKYDDDFIANSLIINPKEKTEHFYTSRYPTAKIISFEKGIKLYSEGDEAYKILLNTKENERIEEE